jgi:hypothetical protein
MLEKRFWVAQRPFDLAQGRLFSAAIELSFRRSYRRARIPQLKQNGPQA